MSNPLLEIRDVTLGIGRTGPKIVKGANLAIAPGEIVGIVGESGSGKTMLGRAVLGLSPAPISMTAGEIYFKGAAYSGMSEPEMRALRGAGVTMVFQEPMTSLNPAMRIGRQLEEGLELHGNIGRKERKARMLDMLRRVGIADGERALAAYPHEFSGGMRQRIMIASAMLMRPALLVADEPTTALDAVTQRDVMDLLVDLTREFGTAVILISHDLPMVARYCSRIVVMQTGEIVEMGETAELLGAPKHDYTRKLLASLPMRASARALPETRPIVSVEKLKVDFAARSGLFGRGGVKHAVRDVSLDIRPGEVLAVVGGSGSGKTTLARVIAGLTGHQGGHVLFNGHGIRPGSAGYDDYRRNCQMVFQDPFSSLDPRMKVGALIAEGLQALHDVPSSEHAARVEKALESVALNASFASRFPHELSGGQRQRVAIARALIRRPSFVIADEAVSALDVTVRAQILKLLADLQSQFGFACLFITHDLSVVEQIADRVVVMHEGRIVEEGSRDEILDRPRHDYTRRLLSAIPVLDTTPAGGVELRWRTELGQGAKAFAD
ncbi:ABC transporter ATP-binding protein [Aquamicrobium sp. LC103]|uniref:dipeptide ABC transporter ATP-binding protein n=1 Tax=Aquamicrobium sp. LC103 TaxID=1120658 RepID=UPI00063E9645|nr:ABC transporter ATP-binding protein [Aquamicrobium sp. LC103]TKT76321.1 ABC transporter ATP-binding protein [Aquamicrobium sp. LC103]